MLLRLKTVFIALLLFTHQAVFALQEKHLVIIHHGESESNLTFNHNSNPQHTNYKEMYLTEKGRQQVKQTAELLLTHGFDNRNIRAVYVSPLPRALETANILSQISVFSKDKIHPEPRIAEIHAGEKEGQPQSILLRESGWVGEQEARSYRGESSNDVRKRMLKIYEEVEKQPGKNHVLFITHGIPAKELIEALTKDKIKLETGQLYIIPLSKLEEIS